MLPPEQARDLVKWAGNQPAAAKLIGVPRSTLAYWLYPDRYRAQRRAKYAADPELRRAAVREHYHSETSLQRGHRFLRMRRTKALHRRAQRHQRRAT